MPKRPQDIRARIREAAREMYGIAKRMYGTPVRWEPASPGDFPDLDLPFYDATARQLESLSFRRLGDFRVAEPRPPDDDFATFFRVLVSADGVTTAGVHHMRSRGRTRVMQAELGRVTNIRTIDFTTEFVDGTWLLTDNLKGRTPEFPVPQKTHQRLGPTAPLSALLKVHEAAVARLREGRPPRTPVLVRTVEDAYASAGRTSATARAQRQKVGYLDVLAERRGWVERLGSEDLADLLVSEIAALQAADAAHATAGEPIAPAATARAQGHSP